MADLKIRKLPDPCLRKPAEEIDAITPTEGAILADMAQTMYLNTGVGLAATQVGIDKKMAVIDVGNGLIKLINPVIVKKEGFETQEEGCLSVPNVTVKVRRAKKVIVDFLNERGDVVRVAADGLFARAIQHEIDHLCGKLIVDYLNPIKKIFLRNKKK